jgi:hypothetical protein
MPRLNYGSAAQRQCLCRTRPDSKGESIEKLAVLAEHMRMYVYKIEHLVAGFSKFIMSPFIVRHSYTQIRNIKKIKPPLSLMLSPSVIGGSSILYNILDCKFPACYLDKSH